MTSPYCVTATDYARDLYVGAADATMRQHPGLALRHGPGHGASVNYRQAPSSTSSLTDMKFDRGTDASSAVYELGPSGPSAGISWTSHEMYAPSSATLRANHRVGHSFPSVSLEGSAVNSAWHNFPAYVQPCEYKNKTDIELCRRLSNEAKRVFINNVQLCLSVSWLSRAQLSLVLLPFVSLY